MFKAPRPKCPIYERERVQWRCYFQAFAASQHLVIGSIPNPRVAHGFHSAKGVAGQWHNKHYIPNLIVRGTERDFGGLLGKNVIQQ